MRDAWYLHPSVSAGSLYLVSLLPCSLRLLSAAAHTPTHLGVCVKNPVTGAMHVAVPCSTNDVIFSTAKWCWRPLMSCSNEGVLLCAATPMWLPACGSSHMTPTHETRRSTDATLTQADDFDIVTMHFADFCSVCSLMVGGGNSMLL